MSRARILRPPGGVRIDGWPLLRQITGRDRADRLGLGSSARSPRSAELRPRTETADRVVRSICPYCAVGCGQRVFVRDGRVIQIEGDPDSPISRGRLCPKGAASMSLVNSPVRLRKVRYRRPGGRQWEDLPLDQAMDMIADRVIATRDATWQDRDDQGRPLNRTLGIASLGGATLDNEENYLIKKLFSGLGVVQVENQARI
jgi:formate dehydrogenase major subunit